MTLIKCNECGCDISDRAKVCPHCGSSNLRPTNDRRKLSKIIVCSLLILLTVVCVYFAFNAIETFTHFWARWGFNLEWFITSVSLLLGMVVCLWGIVRVLKPLKRSARYIIYGIGALVLVMAITRFAERYISLVRPCVIFEEQYCNSGVVDNLQGKFIKVDGDEVFCEIKGKSVTFIVDNIVKSTNEISDISDNGIFTVKVDSESLLNIFGDKISEYFTKIELNGNDSTKEYGLMRFCPNRYDREFIIDYSAVIKTSGSASYNSNPYSALSSITKGVHDGAYEAARNAINGISINRPRYYRVEITKTIHSHVFSD